MTAAVHGHDLRDVSGADVYLNDEVVADTFNEQGWPAKVDGGALTAEYSAPSAGPPPWLVYRIKPDTVYAFGTAEPGGATKFELG